MSAKIIDGKAIAADIRSEIKKKVDGFTNEGRRSPALAVILVGRDPASEIYVKNKRKDCAKAGIKSVEHLLNDTVKEIELLHVIDRLNRDPEIDGILLQLPLPGKLHEHAILEHILPEKDVDGFHPVNIGRLVTRTPGLRPCTPAGIVAMLKRTGIDLPGKTVAVLGRSNIVGKPIAQMLLNEHCTVTTCHSKTCNTVDVSHGADILIAAVGKAKFVTVEMVKPGAIVIDVGINREEEGLVGDVDFENVKEIAAHITPVPGGVGPMTRAMLLNNTVKAYKLHEGIE